MNYAEQQQVQIKINLERRTESRPGKTERMEYYMKLPGINAAENWLRDTALSQVGQRKDPATKNKNPGAYKKNQGWNNDSGTS